MRIEPDPLVKDIVDVLCADTEAPSPARLEMGWRRLRHSLEETERREKRAFWSRLGWARYAFAGVLAIAGLGILGWRYLPSAVDQPLAYRIEGTTLGTAGTVAAGDSAAVWFSDESHLRLAPASRLRMLGTDARGARVALDTGSVEVFVRPRPQASWRFEAGPFTVFVKGTSFRLGFDARKGRLDLHMRTGVVEVRGPQPERVLTLHAGESLELFAKPPTQAVLDPPPTAVPAMEMETAPGPSPVASAPHDEPNHPSPRKRASRSLPTPATGATAMASPTWTDHITQGDFAAIVREAEQRGLDSVFATASPANLTALADAARYTRRAEIARQALLAIRARFPGSDRACDAAFFLGRLSEGGPGASDAAITWYETYLREAPRGPYAAESMGRELALLSKQESPQATAIARRYLDRFPKGSHGELARSLLH